MIRKYQSYQFDVDNGQGVAKTKLWETDKPENQISQWLILVQYAYEQGGFPPSGINGSIVSITGSANGILEITNSLLTSQRVVPVVGARYLVFGREIIVGIESAGGNAQRLFLSAIEDPAPIIDSENQLTDAGGPYVIPQFSTSFTVYKAATIEQIDIDTNVLISSPVTPGQYVPIHPLAFFVRDATPQANLFNFRKGFS